MEKELFESVLQFYYNAIKLKTIERTGWKNWNVSRDKRVESIFEHVSGVQQLAWAIYSQFDINVDIFKVISMLSLHETEEIEMPDYTPLDNISNEQRKEMGYKATRSVCKNLNKKNLILNLVDEFDQRSTPEAKFAYLCDKMESDLQAKRYDIDGRVFIESASQKVLQNSKIKRIIESGAKTVSEVFIEYDKYIYEDSEIFKELLEFLRTYSE